MTNSKTTKWITTFSFMIPLLLLFGGCRNDVRPTSTTSEDLDSATEDVDTTMIYYENSVKGHKEVTKIVGCFIKGKIDTLYIKQIALSWEEVYEDDTVKDKYHSVIYSSNPDIPPLDIYYNICPMLVNEGDLDGNGTTEFGILDTWHTSSCRRYRIYTFHKNHWVYLIPPIETAENLRSSGLELAKPAQRNRIKIRYSDFNAPRSSCAEAPIREKTVSPSFIEIEDED